MNIFQRKPTIDKFRREIRTWLVELAPEAADAIVTINELHCDEQGCPPVETSIAVLQAGAATRQYKVLKALDAVTRDDVAQALGGATEGA
jgi:hypothetical protein